ncbi:MAG TPA: phage holin family protein, partial [Thermomicrobiales bacterium]|nr:phage holin family protein [Thermomicrobiales bacterium]
MQHALTRTTIRIIQHVVVWALQAFLLISFAGWFETIEIETYDDAFLGIVTVSAINAFVMPPLIQLAIRVRALLFPIVSFGINAGVVLLTDLFLPGWDIRGLGPAALLALALAGLSTFLGTLLAISDDAAWRRFVLVPTHARMQREPRIQTDVPGYAFLEIDGLSAPVLREAIRKGYAPNLERWLESGSHELTAWEPDLSSQTSSSQAGILLGNNENIPAFRWYDRNARRVMVSNTVRDSAALEVRLSTGTGLLVDDGASRGNLFSGDAPDTLLTFSTIRKPSSRSNRHYTLFYANPYNVGRTIALYFADVVREYAAGIWQLVRNERPRVPRFGVYPWLRAATTSILRELTTFAVAGDLMRGVPSIYATYVAYDEVAHHSGILRADAMRVLRDIDRDFGRLEQVAATAPRPYHLVVLSDHGQSQGATFRQRWGKSLREVVEDAVARGEGHAVAGAVAGDLEVDEGWQSVSALLTDLLSSDDRRAGSVVKAALRNRIRDGEVQIGPTSTRRGWRRQRREPMPPDYDDGKVLVLASGSLGLISMTGWSERLTLEEIEAHFPALITTLLEHEGIGWILVKSQEQGSVVLGPEGAVVVETGQVVGKDPLALYGPRALHHVRRTDSFPDVPDVLVHAAYNPDTGEIPAFEELVGSHGGLGGYQAEPFLLYPGGL